MENAHFKEKQPEETVQLIKKILNEMNIEIDELWIPTSTLETYSVRVNIRGSQIGANGKGVTREYALASAYAEFLERFQNKALGIDTDDSYEKYGYMYVHDERYMDATEIIHNNSVFIQNLFCQLSFDNIDERERILKFEELFMPRKSKNGSYLMYPFYNITLDKIEYLPLFIIAPHYGSNGMCAGNTCEEALVQGFSEIFERYVQKKVIEEKIALPDIPDEYIKKFPYVYKMYRKINELDGYKLYVKDCSLGGRFPVIALIIIEINTGNYGMHFGAHPYFGIALERAFTEASQGRDILKFSKSSQFDFYNQDVYTISNFYNLYDIAKGKYPFEIFGKESDYEFVPFEDVTTKTNKELLIKTIQLIKTMGYSIYVRDVSVLELYAYHIIIPELSDLTQFEEKEIRASNTLKYVEDLLAMPSKITNENVFYVISVIKHYYHYQAYKKMKDFYERKDDFIYPYQNGGYDVIYFIAMCYVLKEDYIKAFETVELIKRQFANNFNEEKNLIATYNYLKGRSTGLIHNDVMSYIRKFFDDDICNSIDNMYLEPSQVIKNQFLDDMVLKNKREIKLLDAMDKLNNKETKKNINQDQFRIFIKGDILNEKI